MVEYPTENQIIDLNKRIIETVIDKKADRHKLLKRESISIALNKAKRKEGDIYDKSAVLLSELVRNHAFDSGNRRTAYATIKAFLNANGFPLKVSSEERVLQGIRENFYTMSEIKEWLIGNEVRPFNR